MNISAVENQAMIADFLRAISGKPKPVEVVDYYVAESDDVFRRHIHHYEAAFPHFELIAEDLIALGRCVLACLRLRGVHQGDLWSLPPMTMASARPLRPTHTGDFMGLSPTGKPIDLSLQVLFRVAGGRIVEHRIVYDANDLLRQLGLSPQRQPIVAKWAGRRGGRMAE